ncbi:trypsin-2-like [Condylostylus longicornis]|uniref:trypsin-2-like n=1 Tax=Condylostylus longicornis TaxID=2530218 RepID=UPI00244E5923|nr:trypsin-2-like [Condylostylus longicornis]
MRKLIILLLVSLAILVTFVQKNDAISSGTSVTSMSGVGYTAAVWCPIIMCASAVISTKGVLTTATCVNNLSPSDILVLVGSTTYYSGGQFMDIAKIIQHTAFNPTTYNANLAILGFATELDSGTMSTYGITVVPLCTAAAATNTYGTITAYGAINANMDLPDNMQRAFLLVLPSSICTTYKPNRLTTTMFCAGDSTGKKDLCPEDQGAPFVATGKLCGNYNWGCSCGLAAPQYSTPVFNQIYLFATWINTNLATL